jgi:hypothetical protein
MGIRAMEMILFSNLFFCQLVRHCVFVVKCGVGRFVLNGFNEVSRANNLRTHFPFNSADDFVRVWTSRHLRHLCFLLSA